MLIGNRIKKVKIVLVIIAIIIAFSSLVTSHILIKDLSFEERNKMEVWSEAMRSFNIADERTDLTLVLKVLNGNNTIPVIVVNKKGTIQSYRNISAPASDSDKYLRNKIKSFGYNNHRIRIYLQSQLNGINTDKTDYIDIYYDDSLMLKRLATYPYVQLGVVFLFVLIAVFAMLSSKKAEQNKVWVGLSKETAHQLGTPISSLMAWVEILKLRYTDDELISEMGDDVNRLKLIADRFSKIGSMPELQLCDLNILLNNVVDYLSRRCSGKIIFVRNYINEPVLVKLSSSLFEWVIENLCKNAIDSMEGQGNITISVKSNEKKVFIDVSDTGKGVLKSKYITIFEPGYTTKKRGWGLGLSLAKRIVEEYHHGKIFVKRSELNKGTTFRIELKK
ncbi:HAMP domain-containing sensor histidine kinase [uncultured Bacteroides sp.]|uniref:sensor histidine kinase n=1 Tax=uncultured Bacteroides sp. TaxID=162156 RepID=UPI002AAB5F3F|nr:HAMP domain-containing sensor histidine kinase [uncultured Bacteroides sp.]